jgi:hypothetical protein
VAGAVSVIAVGLSACGGDSSSGSASTTGQQANAGRGAFSDPKVVSCLKKQGVEVPSFRRPDGQPPNGQQPGDGSGQPPADGAQPPNGQPPNGGSRNSAEAQKLRKALQKCGVTLPDRGQNGQPPQQDATPSDTTAS